MELNEEQASAVAVGRAGNVVVTACPGSGKTRVLTARVIRGLVELTSPKQFVIALTFTNRAADEICLRLDEENIPTTNLWAGTIHSFALEWVLRPYAPYSTRICNGFSIADEYLTEKLIENIKRESGVTGFIDVDTALSRTGNDFNATPQQELIFSRYKTKLQEMKLIDYDDVLFIAYEMLTRNSEIAETLSSIIRLICVDEVQDVQDLQYGILSTIYQSTNSPPVLFFVGDADQSIYESLGAMTKTPSEIATEFGLARIEHRELTGNYRSTQRIIDYYRNFRPSVPTIDSRTDYSNVRGRITFQDQAVNKDQLPQCIANIISDALLSGVPQHEICVLAPQWWHVRALSRRLVALLPRVDFDAPGLSPIHCSRDNIWFKISRLFLMEPAPSRILTRMRWAKEVITDLSHVADITIPDCITTPRRLLRLINSITSNETDGMVYLQSVFQQFIVHIGLDLNSFAVLRESYNTFFEKAQRRIMEAEGEMPVDVASLRKLFSHPSGVVISTCHGVKGEEYDTVIAFGLLRGYVPHWSVIINGTPDEALERESKLLYVICSRAKKHLHLIAETGRTTQRGNPYETAQLLREIQFVYD